MTHDDSRLRDRLSALAAAVPTAGPDGDAVGMTVKPSGVRSGPIGRGYRPGTTAAIAIVVVGLVLAGAITLRPLGSGRPVATGPVIGTTVDGPFELTIRSAKGEYAADEPVSVQASLVYNGPDPQVRISHGLGGPLGFGLTEPIHGIQLSPGWRLSCNVSALQRNVPIEAAVFYKSGGFDGNDPDASAKAVFFADPILRLPPGTWHVYALAVFSLGDCSADAQRYDIRAEVTVLVPDEHGFVPTAPLPTPTTNPLDLPVGDDTQDGAIQLTLTSPHGRFKAGDAIEVIAGLANGGADGPVTTYGSSDGPVLFSIRQLDGPIAIDPIVLADCVEQVTLPLYEPLQIPFRKSGTVPAGAADPDYWRAWFGDPLLRLPAGTWEISAAPTFSLPTCGGKTPKVRPTITIVVTP